MHQFRQTLDLFVEEDNNHVIMKVSSGHLLSYHHVIHMIVNINNWKLPVKTITYRKAKNLDHSFFGRDIEKLLQLWQLWNLDPIVREYNQILTDALDTYASLRTKTLKVTHKQPWLMDMIRQEIRLWRFKERKWLKDQTQYNFQAFRYHRRHVANIIQAAKWNHFNTANQLLYWNEPSP